MDELKVEFGNDLYQLFTHSDFNILTRDTYQGDLPLLRWKFTFTEHNNHAEPHGRSSRRTILGGYGLVEAVREAQKWIGALSYQMAIAVPKDSARQLATIVTCASFVGINRYVTSLPTGTNEIPTPRTYCYRIDFEETSPNRVSTRNVEADSLEGAITLAYQYIPMSHRINVAQTTGYQYHES